MLSLGSKLPMYSVAQQMDEDDAVTFSQFLHVVIQAHYHHGPYKLETLLHNALRYWYVYILLNKCKDHAKIYFGLSFTTIDLIYYPLLLKVYWSRLAYSRLYDWSR